MKKKTKILMGGINIENYENIKLFKIDFERRIIYQEGYHFRSTMFHRILT